MGTLNTMFTKDILLDSDKFQYAASEFATLSNEMNRLKKDIEKLLEELEKGFDTPAGRKFISSCRNGLLQPMNDQAVVIKHVAENLSMARSKYNSVFTEFQALNNIINQ